jgi:pyruvate-formate lyase
MNQRVQYLKDRLRNTKPHICPERAVLVTEFYRRCSMDAPLIKRAKMLDYLLSNMTIYIGDKELIVGNIAKEYRGVPVFPEFGTNWIIDSIDEFNIRGTNPLILSEENKTILLEALSFWKDQSFKELIDEKLSKEVLEAEKYGVLSVGSRTTSTGHVVPNYTKVLSLGLKGIINEAKKRKASIKMVDHDLQRKIDFWDAIIIACTACIKFAHRYSDLAKEMAAREKDAARQEELMKISENCRWVPENPPRTTYEAGHIFHH